jgi:hypothetical protein
MGHTSDWTIQNMAVAWIFKVLRTVTKEPNMGLSRNLQVE